MGFVLKLYKIIEISIPVYYNHGVVTRAILALNYAFE